MGSVREKEEKENMFECLRMKEKGKVCVLVAVKNLLLCL